MSASKITKVINANRKFGAAEYYYHVTVDRDGNVVDLLLTEDELNRAARRGALNPEDVPQEPRGSWLSRMFGK